MKIFTRSSDPWKFLIVCFLFLPLIILIATHGSFLRPILRKERAIAFVEATTRNVKLDRLTKNDTIGNFSKRLERYFGMYELPKLVSSARCLSLSAGPALRRCEFHYICWHNSNYLFFSPSDTLSRVEVTDALGVISKDAMSSNKEPLVYADTRGNMPFRPLLIKENLADYARRSGVLQTVWSSNPLLLHSKHGVTNGGHALLENLFPLALNLLFFELQYTKGSKHSIFDNEIVFLEDTYDNGSDCGCFSNVFACGSEPRNVQYLSLCKKFTDTYLGALSYRAVQYQNMLVLNNNTMKCWDRAYVGTGGAGSFTLPNQRESHGLYHTLVRDLLYQRSNILQYSLSQRLEKVCQTHSLQVLIAVKEGKRIVSNLLNVADWSLNHKIFHALLGMVEFSIKMVHWEETQSLKHQIEILKGTDILISSAGAGAAQSLLLPDATAVILGSFCEEKNSSQGFSCLAFENPVWHDHQPNYAFFTYNVEDLSELLPSTVFPFLDLVFQKEKYLSLLDTAAAFVTDRFEFFDYAICFCQTAFMSSHNLPIYHLFLQISKFV